MRASPFQVSTMPKKFSTMRATAGGRIATISGSSPTMIVSVWCRV
jgi:hypothetical protein